MSGKLITSSVAGRKPTTTNLNTQQVGVNTADGKIYVNDGGQIVDLLEGVGSDPTLENRVTTNEGDITSLETRMTTNEGDITSLENRVTTNEGDITSLETRMTAEEAAIPMQLDHTGATKALAVATGLSVTGDLIATGDVGGFSDVRLKKDINRITEALDKVCSLSGNHYFKKHALDSEEFFAEVGVLAQEVQSVLPEAVVEHNELLAVLNMPLVALLIEAVKEERTARESLEERIEKLEQFMI